MKKKIIFLIAALLTISITGDSSLLTEVVKKIDYDLQAFTTNSECLEKINEHLPILLEKTRFVG